MGFGGMMVNRIDVGHFLNMRRSPTSFFHLAKLTARFCLDRLRYSRGTRLVIGNAMVAALIKAALERGVEFRRGDRDDVVPDSTSNGAVTGVVVRGADGRSIRDPRAEPASSSAPAVSAGARACSPIGPTRATTT